MSDEKKETTSQTNQQNDLKSPIINLMMTE